MIAAFIFIYCFNLNNLKFIIFRKCLNAKDFIKEDIIIIKKKSSLEEGLLKKDIIDIEIKKLLDLLRKLFLNNKKLNLLMLLVL